MSNKVNSLRKENKITIIQQVLVKAKVLLISPNFKCHLKILIKASLHSKFLNILNNLIKISQSNKSSRNKIKLANFKISKTNAKQKINKNLIFRQNKEKKQKILIMAFLLSKV